MEFTLQKTESLAKQVEESESRATKRPFVLDSDYSLVPQTLTCSSLDDLPQEIFVKILKYLTLEEVLSLWKTCSACRSKCNDGPTWKRFVEQAWSRYGHFLEPFIDRSDVSMRDLYVAAIRSKTNVCGIPVPQCEKLKKYKKWMVNNEMKPFWILHLWTKRKEGKYYSWTAPKDDTSYFGTIAQLHESQKIEIEGRIKVWVPFTYKVIWRLRLDTDFTLNNVTFLTTVGTEEHMFIWDQEDQNSRAVETWFDLQVATITITNAPITIVLAMRQRDLDFKYSLSVDFVELQPVPPV